MHPALMDLATGWAMGLIAGYRPDHLWVPVSYGRVRVWGRSRRASSAGSAMLPPMRRRGRWRFST
ncbi:hypothetical protein ACFSHQ_04525 [Gemmobacter lanyuensis]